MARLYDWEAFLTERERHQMERWGLLVEGTKREVERLQANRDAVRRKCVQRARNALNKEARRLMAARDA